MSDSPQPAAPAQNGDPPADDNFVRRWCRRLHVPSEAPEAVEGAIRALRLPILRKKPGQAAGVDTTHAPHIGDMPERVVVSVMDYSPDDVQYFDVMDLDAFLSNHRPDWATVRWINIDGTHDVRVVQALAHKYELHPLAAEDIIHTPQRPKLDAYHAQPGQLPRLFFVAHMLQLKDGHLTCEQVNMQLGRKTVITFQQYCGGDVWDPIRNRILMAGSKLRNNDASFLAYSLLDAIVDQCFPILEYYGDRLEELEGRVEMEQDLALAKEIHAIKRDLILVRRQVWPLRDMLHNVQIEQHECLSSTTQTYMRDVHDHAVQILDLVETYREFSGGLTDVYLNSLGHRTNQIMKVLTMISSVFIPISFLTGVFGMNFDSVPGLRSSWSFAAFCAACSTIMVGMFIFFRKQKWL